MNRTRVLIVGADAAGMSAATTAKRAQSELVIEAFEQSAFASYSA